MTGLRWTDEMFQQHQARVKSPASKSPPQGSSGRKADGGILLSGEPPAGVAHEEIEIHTISQYKHQHAHPLLLMCSAAALPQPKTEFRFHPTRKWAFDYCWPDRLVALEVEGGIWRKGGGAHSHPLNIERDLSKYNAAALLGFRVLRYAPEDLKNSIADLRIMFAGG